MAKSEACTVVLSAIPFPDFSTGLNWNLYN